MVAGDSGLCRRSWAAGSNGTTTQEAEDGSDDLGNGRGNRQQAGDPGNDGPKDAGSKGCGFQEINSNEEEEDGGAHCVLPRDGLQIGKTTLSFVSKEIAMAIGGCHLRNYPAAAVSQKRGFYEEEKEKKKEGRASGQSVSPSATKGLWHAAMLCFVGKQRPLIEKSTDD
ncbi:hypothetical protein BHM03_00032578 [Ensete ventricosum]|nr:hypothetical protein BHM03_00032578 [Ensete ventricosum]